MQYRLSTLPGFVILYLFMACSHAEDTDNCLMFESDEERLQCYDNLSTQLSDDQVLQQRSKYADASQANPFSITPFRPNYLLPVSINTSPNREPFEQNIEPGSSMDSVEVKFQVSFEVDILRNIEQSGIDLYFTFTQLSFWQAYNSDASSPFRESNYEPEIGVKLNPNYELFGIRSFELRLGLVHQSNGRRDPISRSWNRVAASLIFDRENYVSILRPWVRIQEDEVDDNNPDIEDYLGNFEWYNFYKKGESTYAVMIRNNLQTGENRSAIQLDMGLALNRRFKLYLQYFHGYGESLIDYNHRNNSFSIGIMLTDWL